MSDDFPRQGALRAVTQRLAGGGVTAFVGMLNHLLRQNDWARARLAPFAQRPVSVALETASFARMDPPHLVARVTAEGLLDSSVAAADESAEAPVQPVDVAMHVRPSLVAPGALLRKNARGLTPWVRIEGEAMLAAALGEVVERIRWDPEEDLSRVTGDIVARRIGRGVAATRGAMREMRGRLAAATGRRFANATGTLVGGDELESLRASLDALESRVSGLETPAFTPAGPASDGSAVD